PRREAKREELAVVAALDAVGLLLTLVAAVVLGVSNGANRVWWLVVGVAVLLSVVTTAMLVRLIARRRALSSDVDEMVQLLEFPEYSEDFGSAGSLIEELRAAGEVRLANRLE